MMLFSEPKETYPSGKLLVESQNGKVYLLGNKVTKPVQCQPKHIKDILSKMGLPVVENKGQE